MVKSRSFKLLFGCRFAPSSFQCRQRPFSSSSGRENTPEQNPSTTEQATSKPTGNGRDEKFTPKPLNHPLGLQHVPQVGENTGVDARTLGQRGRDFVNHEKHIERRVHLATEFSKPYFREWSRMNYHHGKTFISNPRLFKQEKAYYFPNLYGRTLLRKDPMKDTTPILHGKLSIVAMFSSLWAERQTASFVGVKQNPALHKMMNEASSLVQRVDINTEENRLRTWLIRMFMWRLRRTLPEEHYDRYFLVSKGLTNYLKDQIGMINSKVGYVYLLDEKCKIRWAGSSIAEPGELESLNKGLKKLIEERTSGEAADNIAVNPDSALKKEAQIG